MQQTFVPAAALALTLLIVVGCAAPSGPPGQPSSSDVNPITGSRGGSAGAPGR